MLKTSGSRIAVFVASVLLLAGLSPAKDLELKVKWAELPPSLTGQRLKISETDQKYVSGTLTSIDANQLVLNNRSKTLKVSRTAVERIETRPRLKRSGGRIIGLAVGGGIGAVVTGFFATYAANEGGARADALVGAAVGLAVGATVLGYFAGRASDSDRTLYSIIPE